MDASTHQIITALITDKEVAGGRMLAPQLKQVGTPVERVYGDGAYDTRQCYRAIHQKGARAIIPPRKRSTQWQDSYLAVRNKNLCEGLRHGLKGWEKGGYHRRSLVETAFFRLKTTFSDKLRSRRDDTLVAEVMIRCAALNRMTGLGMPDSYRVWVMSSFKLGLFFFPIYATTPVTLAANID
jgi:Transposase DDE domain